MYSKRLECRGLCGLLQCHASAVFCVQTGLVSCPVRITPRLLLLLLTCRSWHFSCSSAAGNSPEERRKQMPTVMMFKVPAVTLRLAADLVGVLHCVVFHPINNLSTAAATGSHPITETAHRVVHHSHRAQEAGLNQLQRGHMCSHLPPTSSSSTSSASPAAPAPSSTPCAPALHPSLHAAAP